MSPPNIEGIKDDAERPLWSIMIPTYNCAQYLNQTLNSVLLQDQGINQMHIEVVDDCSTQDNPEKVVRDVGQGRVNFYRKPKNEGAIANFNTCIRRSRGYLVHILHGDDYVLQEFYTKIGIAAKHYQQVALFASRSFFVDEANIIGGVTERMCELEAGGTSIERFFYGTPLQTPSVVVRRDLYETLGGFIPDLIHTADCEMWARAVNSMGGLVLPEVLACYRTFSQNDSNRLARTSENLQDIKRLNGLFAKRYSQFNYKKAAQRINRIAVSQAKFFAAKGDFEAVEASLNYLKMNAPLSFRLRYVLSKITKNILK